MFIPLNVIQCILHGHALIVTFLDGTIWDSMYTKRVAACGLGLMAVLSGAATYATDEGRSTAQGAGYALVIAEKCGGHPRSMEQVTVAQRGLFNSMQRSGYGFEEIKAGYLEGVLAAERRFPGASRPPKRECQEAEKIKQAIDQLR